jgi:hypothetical protein
MKAFYYSLLFVVEAGRWISINRWPIVGFFIGGYLACLYLYA